MASDLSGYADGALAWTTWGSSVVSEEAPEVAMLRRDERRSLEEIERRLVAEDPDWAMSLSEAGPGGARWVLSAPTVLAAITFALAVVLLVLGQVASAFVGATLGTALVLSRTVRLHA